MERAVWLAGETVTLQVRVGWDSAQNPRSRLRWEWTKNGSLISAESAGSGVVITTARRVAEFIIQLQVGVASETDSGMYACEVSTSLGSKVVHFEPLSVFAFDVSTMGHPTDSRFFSGLNLDLSCRVSISPGLFREHLSSVEVEWVGPGGVALEARDHPTVSGSVRVDRPPTVSGDVVYQNNISFSPLMAGDEGDYVCMVTCHLGNGRQVVTNQTRLLQFDSE